MADIIELLGTDYLSDSREDLNDNFEVIRGRFRGATAPSNPIAGDLWADTGTGYEKERNAANDAWIVMRKLGAEYGALLPLAGGTMAGAINMGGYGLTNLALGSGTAAARQQEVDLKADIAAPTFTGDAKVSQDPAGDDSIPRRSWTEARYLKLSGGTLTGPLVLAGDASAALNPVSLQQLGPYVAFNTTTGHRHDGSDARKIKGSSLDAESSVDGAVAASNGAGAAAWTPVPMDYLETSGEQTLLVTRSSSIGWTNVSLAAIVPADTHVALLKVEIISAGVATTIEASLRPGGVTVTNPQTWVGELDTTRQYATAMLLASRTFDYMFSTTGTDTLKIYLIGYMRSS